MLINTGSKGANFGSNRPKSVQRCQLTSETFPRKSGQFGHEQAAHQRQLRCVCVWAAAREWRRNDNRSGKITRLHVVPQRLPWHVLLQETLVGDCRLSGRGWSPELLHGTLHQSTSTRQLGETRAMVNPTSAESEPPSANFGQNVYDLTESRFQPKSARTKIRRRVRIKLKHIRPNLDDLDLTWSKFDRISPEIA